MRIKRSVVVTLKYLIICAAVGAYLFVKHTFHLTDADKIVALFAVVIVASLLIRFLYKSAQIDVKTRFDNMVENVTGNIRKTKCEVLFEALQKSDYINKEKLEPFIQRHALLNTFDEEARVIEFTRDGELLTDKEKWELGLPPEQPYSKEFIELFNPIAFQTIEPREWFVKNYVEECDKDPEVPD